ncbi:MAG: DDE-type integrase/transposase/recombinase [Saprospiraceae bacterium]|nr:DDE-type integrase/transposase/recombinase [Candidatus Brachybacter algidus]
MTYLPKFDGSKYYLYVAIDRATRLMYYKVYKNKTAQSATDFLALCKSFFPFYISHVLTDNGLEFTNSLIRSKKDSHVVWNLNLICYAMNLILITD